jgi:hypothetical protein
LVVSDLTTTLALFSGIAGKIDNAFSRMLECGPTWRLSGDELTLACPSGLELTFRSAPGSAAVIGS